SNIFACYNTFQKVPFPYRLFHVLFSPKINCILPSWIPAPPIDSAFVDGDQVPTRLKYMAAALQPLGNWATDSEAIRPITHYNEITCATFYHLNLYGVHPGAGVSTIFSD